MKKNAQSFCEKKLFIDFGLQTAKQVLKIFFLLFLDLPYCSIFLSLTSFVHTSTILSFCFLNPVFVLYSFFEYRCIKTTRIFPSFDSSTKFDKVFYQHEVLQYHITVSKTFLKHQSRCRRRVNNGKNNCTYSNSCFLFFCFSQERETNSRRVLRFDQTRTLIPWANITRTNFPSNQCIDKI